MAEVVADGSFGGIGTLSAEGTVLSIRYFLKAPKVTIQNQIATHVKVISDTNDATAHTTPEVSADEVIERWVTIESGNEAVCQAVANILIAKWGVEQKSVEGIIDLTVVLRFKEKVFVEVPECNIKETLILLKKTHNIVGKTTSLVLGDMLIDDNELISRILDKLNI